MKGLNELNNGLEKTVTQAFHELKSTRQEKKGKLGQERTRGKSDTNGN